MFCKKCGAEISNDSKFCQSCGASIEIVEEVKEETAPTFSEVGAEAPKQAKCWGIFAKVGYGLGLAGLICCCIPFVCFLGFELVVPGLVFSILGKRSIEFGDKGKKGIIFSAVGLGIGFVLVIISSVIILSSGYEDIINEYVNMYA